jgi:hypothetical protein
MPFQEQLDPPAMSRQDALVGTGAHRQIYRASRRL